MKWWFKGRISCWKFRFFSQNVLIVPFNHLYSKSIIGLKEIIIHWFHFKRRKPYWEFNEECFLMESGSHIMTYTRSFWVAFSACGSHLCRLFISEDAVQKHLIGYHCDDFCANTSVVEVLFLLLDITNSYRKTAQWWLNVYQ